MGYKLNPQDYQDFAADFEKNISFKENNGEAFSQEKMQCEVVSYLKFMGESIGERVGEIINGPSVVSLVKEMTPEFKQKHYIRSFTIQMKDIEKIAGLLECFEENYNEPMGVVNFLKDFNIKMSFMQFWRFIPAEMKERMTSLRRVDISRKNYNLLQKEFELLEKGEVVPENSIRGELEWLNRVFPNGIYIPQFWSFFPEEFREKYDDWFCLKLNSLEAEEILNRFEQYPFHELIADYNDKSGKYRWLRDNGFNKTHLGNFSSIIPDEIKEVMTEWIFEDISYKKAEKRYEKNVNSQGMAA